MGFAGDRLQAVNWQQMNLPAVNKEIYAEHPTVSNRSPSEVSQWIRENQLTLSGERIPRPVFEFNETTFPGMLSIACLPPSPP